MIWGCISHNYKNPIIILPKSSIKGHDYVNWILKPYLKPFYNQQFVEMGEAIVREDRALPHRSKIAQVARYHIKIQKMPWLPQSPDLNRIENH